MAEVRLREMRLDEFEVWRRVQVQGFADDAVRNGRFLAGNALERAEESFRSLLPDGIDTEGHTIWIGEDPDTGRRVGTLWLGPADDPGRAWVWSVEVDAPFRGRGFGRAMMVAFEREATARGYTSVGLNVFADNDVARGLYESLDYTEIARQMTKPLSGDGRGPSGGGT